MPYPVTPKTWVAGDILTAAQLNAELRDALLGAFPIGVDAWTAWTPTLTNMVLGNGVVVARYAKVGRVVHYRFTFTLGSTSTVGSPPSFTLPVAAAAAVTTAMSIGDARLTDAGTADYRGAVWPTSTTVAKLMVNNAAGTYLAHADVSTVIPHAWAVSDVMAAWGTYEAAA